MDMIKLPFSGDKRKHRKPDIKHKAFPKDKFSYRNCIFQTFDETEDFMKVLQLKSN